MAHNLLILIEQMEQVMRNRIASWIVVASALGALAGCGRHQAAKDLAQEVDKALDPAPQFVDEPAKEPRDAQ